MAEVKAALRLTLITGGLAEVQAATRAVKALAAAGQAGARGEAAAATAATRATERSTAAKVKGLKTVEGEMQRLTNLEKNRETTAAARAALGQTAGGGWLTGHGFANKTRQIVGGIRDLTVAGMGVRYAFGAAESAISSVMDPAREFGATMAEVRNKGGFSVAETAAIGSIAKNMGKNSVFSPLEAGKAAVELAAAGLHAPEIQAAMPSTLRFAQAGGLGTEAATATLVETMSQFGLHATDFEHIGDTLVKAANMSTVSVSDLAEGMKYAGPIARAAGISLEFTAGTLALLGENGLKGSQGGTALRKMMDSLVHPAKTAKAALASLGMTPNDLKKGLNDMPGFFEKLQKKMAGKHMDRAHQLEISKLLFGEEGMAAAQILMTKSLDHSSNGWRAYAEQVASASGAMQSAADIAGDTLDGKIKKLDASLMTAKLTIGEAFVPTLNKLVPKLAEAATATGDWAENHQALIGRIPEAAGVALAGTALVKGSGMIAGLVSAVSGAEATAAMSAAGATLGTTIAVGILAGLIGYGIGSKIAQAVGVEDWATRVQEKVSGRKNIGAEGGYRSADNMEDFTGDTTQSSIDARMKALKEKAHANTLAGQIDIHVTDDRVKITTRSNSVPLRTGSNAGSR